MTQVNIDNKIVSTTVRQNEQLFVPIDSDAVTTVESYNSGGTILAYEPSLRTNGVALIKDVGVVDLSDGSVISQPDFNYDTYDYGFSQLRSFCTITDAGYVINFEQLDNDPDIQIKYVDFENDPKNTQIKDYTVHSNTSREADDNFSLFQLKPENKIFFSLDYYDGNDDRTIYRKFNPETGNVYEENRFNTLFSSVSDDENFSGTPITFTNENSWVMAGRFDYNGNNDIFTFAIEYSGDTSDFESNAFEATKADKSISSLRYTGVKLDSTLYQVGDGTYREQKFVDFLQNNDDLQVVDYGIGPDGYVYSVSNGLTRVGPDTLDKTVTNSNYYVVDAALDNVYYSTSTGLSKITNIEQFSSDSGENIWKFNFAGGDYDDYVRINNEVRIGPEEGRDGGVTINADETKFLRSGDTLEANDSGFLINLIKVK